MHHEVAQKGCCLGHNYKDTPLKDLLSQALLPVFAGLLTMVVTGGHPPNYSINPLLVNPSLASPRVQALHMIMKQLPLRQPF